MATSLPSQPRAAGGRLRDAVREVMRPGVIVLAEGASVAQVQRALLSHGVHAVLVLARGGRPAGWATAAGVLACNGRDLASLSARHAVTEEAVTLEPWRPVTDALDLIRRKRAHRVLVAAATGALPEGVVSERDLLAHLSR
jgi:CBS-domain-containing membrane protein